jgi:iron only hydrogenase large subunit-like protein/ferredoxin
MPITIYINSNRVEAEKDEMLLTVLRNNGIRIPTLCNLPDLLPTGACRLCVVEIEDSSVLIPACSTPVSEGLRVLTHSQRVISARQTIVDLLLTNHPDDCLYCNRNRNCELQLLAEELNIRERLFSGRKKLGKTDRSSQGLVLDLQKCILCGRCVKVCEQIVGVSALEHVFRGRKTSISTVFDKGLYYSSCIQCGQCLSVCPTGALSEKSSLTEVSDRLLPNNQPLQAIVSSASLLSVASYYGIRKFDEAAGFVSAALREIGFAAVFPEGFGNDIFIYFLAQIVKELLPQKKFKVILTDCPVVLQWIEQKFSQYAQYIPEIKSPQQIMGKAVHELIEHDKRPVNVAVMPCIGRKNEAMHVKNISRGLPDVDFVLTTIEMLRLFKTRGITYPFPRADLFEKPFVSFSASALLSQSSGGLSESLFRTLEQDIPEIRYKSHPDWRSNKPFRTLSVNYKKQSFGVSILNGLHTINTSFVDVMENEDIHFVELTACQGGCIGGCSQMGSNVSRMQKIISDHVQQSNMQLVQNNPFFKGLLGFNKLVPSIVGNFNNKIEKFIIKK